MTDDATPGGGGSGNRQSDGRQPVPGEPELIDSVSNALDSAEQTLEASSRWFDAQAERAANSAMESIAEHLNPPPDLMPPPLGAPPAPSFGAGEPPSAPEPGLIDRVSNALDSAEQTLAAPSGWFDAQAERAERAADSAMESIAEHFNPPPDVMVPPLGPPPAPSFGAGEVPLGPPPAGTPDSTPAGGDAGLPMHFGAGLEPGWSGLGIDGADFPGDTTLETFGGATFDGGGSGESFAEPSTMSVDPPPMTPETQIDPGPPPLDPANQAPPC